jgi:hypothetical protein
MSQVKLLCALSVFLLAACQSPSARGTLSSVDVSTSLPPKAAPSFEIRTSPDGTAELSWAAVDGATRYHWWEFAPSPSNPEEVDGTTAKASGLLPGRSYHFAVAAGNSNGWGPAASGAIVQPADWAGILGQSRSAVYRVRFARCGSSPCPDDAAGYSVIVSATSSNAHPACRGSLPQPPSGTARSANPPCWSHPSTLIYVSVYQVFCNPTFGAPEFLNAAGAVMYWSDAGCTGRYLGPTANGVAGQASQYGLGGLPLSSTPTRPDDQVLLLSPAATTPADPQVARVVGVGVAVDLPPTLGVPGAHVASGIALGPRAVGARLGSPVVNGSGEVIGTFVPAGTSGQDIGGYVVPWTMS